MHRGGAAGRRAAAGRQMASGSDTAERKLSWKEARELERVEGRIAELEQEKEQLSEQINEVGGDYELLGELAGRWEGIEAELDEGMERWLVLSELGQ